MPYIKKAAREELCGGREPESVGELNYCLTEVVLAYLRRKDCLSYQAINDAIGAIECTKLELYRRVAALYEDEKRRANGDVYD